MCRRSSHLLAMVLCGFALLAGSARADDVSSFLESRGLERLLVIHLEQQMDSMSGDARSATAKRLARLYARLLMSAEDRGDRAYLEMRGLQLLKGIPAGEADDLRVELINGRYLVAEDVAERHRLRLDDLGETQQAIETLDELITELEQVQSRTLRDLEGTTRSIERGAPFRATSRRERLARQEQLLRRTRYLLGWSSYYRAWLSSDPMLAEQAEAIFAELLELEPGFIKPEYVSRDLRSEDVIAWSILGMAASRGMTHSSVTTMLWFDLLEESNVSESIRSMLPGWRLAVLLDNGEYERASMMVDDLQEAGTIIPTTWWRLIAVHALEAGGDAWALQLADRAVAELAARNALNHLYDLVERYGDVLADRGGFALAYARGVLFFQEAKFRSNADGVPETDEAREAYQEAGRLLALALAESDRDQWGTAKAGCGSLLAWCLYSQGRYADARDRFLWVLEQEDRARYEESLWMAIVCQDQVVHIDDQAESIQRLDSLVGRYLSMFPDGARAGELAVRRAAGAEPSFDAVEQLLSVSDQDPAWSDAQHGASRMLYQLFTSGTQEQRVESGGKYLTIAVPLFMLDMEAGSSDAQAAGRAIARSRRILEVALDEGLQRLVAADTVLGALAGLDDMPIESPLGYTYEITYRAVQLDLARGRTEAAQQLVDGLIQLDRTALWTRLAIRALFRFIRDRWMASDASADRRSDAQRLIWYGGLLLQEQASVSEAMESPGMVAVASIVASAGLESWLGSKDESIGQDAWLMYGQLLAVHPRNQEFLRGRGLLSSSQGEAKEAMRCWRLLMNGTSSGSQAWFEARTNLLELLEHADEEHARNVLKQHQVLFPGWGPEPWGSRLRAIHRRLGTTPDGDAP